ncbi:MAG: intracellular septation protein A [Arenicella sp.]|jgi:intracellular septation protein A
MTQLNHSNMGQHSNSDSSDKLSLSEAAVDDVSSSERSGVVKKKPQTSRVFIDLFLCILIPTLILKKLGPEEMLGSTWALVAALSLPLAVAVYEFITLRKIGFVAALGFISILLTGSIGLLKLPSEYIAIKEALIPGVIAIATVVSTYTKHPLIRTFLYNDMIMDVDKVSQRLEHNGGEQEFDKMMVHATWMLASSFILSAVLNFVLAKWLVVSPSGTPEFLSELGTMNLMSYPVIVLPCMVVTIFTLFYVIRNITKITGLGLEDIAHQ